MNTYVFIFPDIKKVVIIDALSLDHARIILQTDWYLDIRAEVNTLVYMATDVYRDNSNN